MPDVVGGLIADGLGLLDFLGGSTVGATASGTLKAYLQRRVETSRELLLEELSRGDILPPEAAARDDAVAVIYHYVRSACVGTARVNLRLLAQAIAGRLRSKTLVAGEFLLHADALSALSRDEIILLATMYRIHNQFRDAPTIKSLWPETVQELEAFDWSKDRVQGVAGRALRSGYVLAASAWGGLAFGPSPLLLSLCETVDFVDALRREGVAIRS